MCVTILAGAARTHARNATPRRAFRLPWLLNAAIALAAAAAPAAAALELTIDAPPALAATARQVSALDSHGVSNGHSAKPVWIHRPG